ncbi:MAG: Gfo/Idh/MocA family oxidoreductase [Candidatus Omnitrophica bacterium]|nr:Gfo/Idh/MocA family oxidoreductase [Candidatus Omnitrophota bacterium]
MDIRISGTFSNGDDIDAVFVVTPDHWHPLLTILGCQAGKDVYVEKPVCPTVVEGRAMVEAARRYGRIVQVGTQQRSMPVFQKAIKVIRSGRIGKVTTASAWIGVNGVGVGETKAPVPDGLDWDLWLGPAPWSPYSPQRHYGFMGWHDYCRGGQLTNWGVHLMDIVHWGIGEDRPLSVQTVGGSYLTGAGAEDYECIDALFEYKGCTVTWEQRHWNAHANKGYGVKFQVPKGSCLSIAAPLWSNRAHWESRSTSENLNAAGRIRPITTTSSTVFAHARSRLPISNRASVPLSRSCWPGFHSRKKEN